MKLALLSDVHGNLPALEAVLLDLKSFDPDLLVVAGDLTGGPFSNEVIQLLRDHGAAMILGNSDEGLLRYIQDEGPEDWKTREQYGMLRWNVRNLSEMSYQIMSELPEQKMLTFTGKDSIRLVHGSPRSINESIYPDQDLSTLDLMLGMIEEPVLVCGHTHEQWYLHRNKKLAVNPGSIAGPLNGVVGAQYACLIWMDQQWHVELHTVSYDLSPLKNAFAESGLLREGGPIGRAFLLSIECGHNVVQDFLTYAFQLAEEAGFGNSKVLPDEVYNRAASTFSWQTY